MSASDADGSIVLLTGATGFVGGQLLPELAKRGPVRCLVRDAGKFAEVAGTKAVVADLLEPGSLADALAGITTAYYLVHSMEPGVGDGFADKDRAAAENFAAAAQEAGLERVIYLGGVNPSEGESEHIDSRREVEEILAGACKELVVLRASMIVGAGSGSFRTMVQLIDRLPVLLMPSWRDRKSQPVWIGDVVMALAGAADVAPGVYDLAGPDILTFEEMTEVVADALGEKTPTVSVPFSDSRVEAAAASVLVDADRELLGPLMEGLHSDLVVRDNALPTVFGIEPKPFAEAAAEAVAEIGD